MKTKNLNVNVLRQKLVKFNFNVQHLTNMHVWRDMAYLVLHACIDLVLSTCSVYKSL